jgi:serpin B
MFVVVALLASPAIPETKDDVRIATADLAPATRAINSLGLDLLPGIGQADSNILFSPYSIQIGLAMAFAGAAGNTRAEMTDALRYPEDEETLHASFAGMSLALEEASREAGRFHEYGPGKKESTSRSLPLVLTVANRLFIEKRCAVLPTFLRCLHDTYHASPSLVDFRGSAALATQTINDWVADQTRQRIVNLIPFGALNGDTRLVLANAIYLKAPWTHPFAERNTRPHPFDVKGGQPVKVATMEEILYLGYQRVKGFEAITIPYLGGDLQFLILLPSKGHRLADLEKRLTADQLAGLAGSPVEEVHMYLPKFRIEPTALQVSGLLAKLGMKEAFSDDADFSRMSRTALAISQVFHKAFIAADEKGTEAAAATAVEIAVVMKSGGGDEPDPPIEVHVDRPFFFAIQHRPSGACLFLGRVTDPR